MEKPKGKQKDSNLPTYEGEILAVLAYEFSPLDEADSNRKIKRRLREKKLGPFDASRLEALRAFQRALRGELGAPAESKFYAGPTGQFADMSDWKFDELVDGMAREHPKVNRAAIGDFVPFAIYLYYLR